MRPLSKRIKNIRPSGIRKYYDVKQADLLNMGGGTIDFDTFEHIHAAAIKAIQDDFTAYTTNSGILPLREAICEKLARDNDLKYTPDEILVTCGSSEALAAAPLAVMEPGDEAIICDPYYSAFGPLTELAGGVPVYIPTYGENNWNPDPDDIERAITPRTRLIWLVSPNNPTGAAQRHDVIRAIAEIAIKHDLYVASDELYERLMFDGQRVLSPASLPGMWERTFTCNGFSKGYAMTGWRIGYVAAPKVLIDALIKAQQYGSICAPSISQAAALAALTGPQEPYARLLEDLDRRRHFVNDRINQIPGLRMQPQDGSFYSFIDARELLQEKGDAIRAVLAQHSRFDLPESQSEQLSDFLLVRGNVALTAGTAFGLCAEGWFRLSEAERIPKLDQGLTRIEEALASI
jgi:aspartate/methionine/tyrosine aminotransferase